MNDASLSAGAGFVVAISGSMMLMPGLPSHPRAMDIDLDPEGKILGVYRLPSAPQCTSAFCSRRSA